MYIIDNSYQFRNLYRNLSWNFLGQLVAKISLLLFHIIFANYVGAVSYGKFSFAFVGGMILLQPILDLGLNQLITKWISRGNFKKTKENTCNIRVFWKKFHICSLQNKNIKEF